MQTAAWQMTNFGLHGVLAGQEGRPSTGEQAAVEELHASGRSLGRRCTEVVACSWLASAALPAQGLMLSDLGKVN